MSHLRFRSAALTVLLAVFPAFPADRAFQFTPPDEKLYAAANELDELYEKKGLVLHDGNAEPQLSVIGTRLIGSEPLPERVQYRFRLLRDPMINAFALPNGSIYVNTGLVAAMENDDQFAAVLAHEVSHVVDRHAYLQNRSIRKKSVAMAAIAVAAGGAGFLFPGAQFGYSIAFASKFSQALIVATVYGHSRELEDAADGAGYERLVGANYDGRAMVRALELLDERLEFEPIEPFWRTHPKLQLRIAEARERSGAGQAGESGRSESEYFEHMAGVIRANVVLDLDSRRARTAVARLQRLVNWSSGAMDRTLLADAYRSLGAKTEKPEPEELSNERKKIARKQMLALTAAEEQQTLLATPSGKSTLATNQKRAEELYREAMAANPRLADPHRGLGMLYQDQGNFHAAAGEYRKYLELTAPDAIDRLRIERRIEASMKSAQKSAEKE